MLNYLSVHKLTSQGIEKKEWLCVKMEKGQLQEAVLEFLTVNRRKEGH